MIISFDPVAFYVSGLPVRWYALSYLLAVLYAYHAPVNPRSGSHCSVQRQWQTVVDRVVFCGLIGGRLGHGLFYDTMLWWSNPWEALYLWHGGMSFFGGMIGAMCGIAWGARKTQLSYWALADRVVSCVPVGIALGRLANILNSECVGRVMTHPSLWSFVYPSLDGVPRYPTQLFEGLFEGVFLYVLLARLPYAAVGLRSSVFLVIYGILRLVIEPFKEPEVLWCMHYSCINPSVLFASCSVVWGLWVWLFRVTENPRQGALERVCPLDSF